MGCTGSSKRIEKLEQEIEDLRKTQNEKLNHIIQLLESQNHTATVVEEPTGSVKEVEPAQPRSPDARMKYEQRKQSIKEQIRCALNTDIPGYVDEFSLNTRSSKSFLA